MSAAAPSDDNKRKLLCRTILKAVNSWPAPDRQVFILAHYAGKKPEAISRTMGLDRREVLRILENRERELRSALRGFRNGGGPSEEDLSVQSVGGALEHHPR